MRGERLGAACMLGRVASIHGTRSLAKMIYCLDSPWVIQRVDNVILTFLVDKREWGTCHDHGRWFETDQAKEGNDQDVVSARIIIKPISFAKTGINRLRDVDAAPATRLNIMPPLVSLPTASLYKRRRRREWMRYRSFDLPDPKSSA